MNEYSADKIIVRNWPKIYQMSDKRWKRVWNIVLVCEQTDATVYREVEEYLSTDEVTIEIAWHGNNLLVSVITDRWAGDDDLIWYYDNILSGINEGIGEIETIQEQARNLWRPWFQGID